MMNMNWYENLNKPLFTPPAEVFAPAWTIFYGLILLSLVIFITTSTFKSKKAGYIYFSIQLILNFLWTPVFFAMQNIELAVVVIILMLIFIILTIIKFFEISRLSAFLLMPYLLWVCFATYLNFGYLVLN